LGSIVAGPDRFAGMMVRAPLDGWLLVCLPKVGNLKGSFNAMSLLR
jgi:hypothetical protein